MNSRLRSVISIPLTVLCLVLATACGNNDSNTPSSPPPAGGGAPLPPQTPTAILARIDQAHDNTLHLWNVQGASLPGYTPINHVQAVQVASTRIAYVREQALYVMDATGRQIGGPLTIDCNPDPMFALSNTAVAYKESNSWHFLTAAGAALNVEGLPTEGEDPISRVFLSDTALVYSVETPHDMTLNVRDANGRRIPGLEPITHIALPEEGGIKLNNTFLAYVITSNTSPQLTIINLRQPPTPLRVLTIALQPAVPLFGVRIDDQYQISDGYIAVMSNHRRAGSAATTVRTVALYDAQGAPLTNLPPALLSYNAETEMRKLTDHFFVSTNQEAGVSSIFDLQNRSSRPPSLEGARHTLMLLTDASNDLQFVLAMTDANSAESEASLGIYDLGATTGRSLLTVVNSSMRDQQEIRTAVESPLAVSH